MIASKENMFFIIPAFVSVLKSIFDDSQIDLVLVVVALVTSLVGSTMQITHENLERRVLLKEIYAIYTTGIVIALIAYMVGDWKNNIIFTMLIGVFGSYISLDLFKYGKQAVLAIIKKLPDVFWEIVKAKLNSKEQNNNNNKNL